MTLTLTPALAHLSHVESWLRPVGGVWNHHVVVATLQQKWYWQDGEWSSVPGKGTPTVVSYHGGQILPSIFVQGVKQSHQCWKQFKQLSCSQSCLAQNGFKANYVIIIITTLSIIFKSNLLIINVAPHWYYSCSFNIVHWIRSDAYPAEQVLLNKQQIWVSERVSRV